MWNSCNVLLKRLDSKDITPDFCKQNMLNDGSASNCRATLLQWSCSRKENYSPPTQGIQHQRRDCPDGGLFNSQRDAEDVYIKECKTESSGEIAIKDELLEEETACVTQEFSQNFSEPFKIKTEQYGSIGYDTKPMMHSDTPLCNQSTSDSIEEGFASTDGPCADVEKIKKRKVDRECRQFKAKWEIKYFFIKANDKALCLICRDSVAVLKEYNIRRHYESKHGSSYSHITGAERTIMFESFQHSLHSEQAVFSKKKCENEISTIASYKVAYVLAKKGKPFTDGSIIKECIVEAAGEVCPEKVNLFKMISLGSNTVGRRIEDLGGDINRQVKEKTKRFCWHSLALDESTDVCDTSQLLVFFRGVDSEFNVTQLLASVHSMHATTTGEDIFNEVSKTMSEYNLEWKQVQCVTIDGGKNMSGTKKGLVRQITTACEVGGFSKPIFLHCLIHQQALCLKYVDMSCVLKPVVSVVNFIRSHALNHRQFRDFLKEIDAEFVDLPYYTAVRWLSCGKVLLHFFGLRFEIDLFLTEKNNPQPLLSECEWIWKLAFFADMTGHMNQLNLKLQGKTNLISDYFFHVKAFRAKLALLEGQVKVNNFAHFPCCEKFYAESKVEFPSSFANEIITDLKKQFQERFADLDAKANEIRIFHNPFDCDAANLPTQFQMEIIDLQADDRLKDKYREGNLIDFYKCLQPEQFPNLIKFACSFVSIFGTTYLCEETFSKMKYVKSNYRANLSDDHLKSILTIGSSNLEPDFNEILKSKPQYHSSH